MSCVCVLTYRYLGDPEAVKQKAVVEKCASALSRLYYALSGASQEFRYEMDPYYSAHVIPLFHRALREPECKILFQGPWPHVGRVSLRVCRVSLQCLIGGECR
jgi:hypothetical protein